MINEETQVKWDAKYRDAERPEPAFVLRENRHLLPARGTALDFACGLGANSILLAEHGLQTYAWDISQVAVDRINAIARECNLPLIAEVRDLAHRHPEPLRFDVIVVAHYLEHSLNRYLIDALKPNGLLFFQTFTQTRVSDAGPQRDEWRLADGELLHMFDPLRPIVYREEGRIGDLSRGYRDKAVLVAVKDDMPQTSRTPHGCAKAELDLDD